MNDWLNKQNKKHMLLCGKDEHLNGQDSIVWFELALQQRIGSLNKKISKISPRRHKRYYAKAIKQLLEDDSLSIQHVIEKLENEYS